MMERMKSYLLSLILFVGVAVLEHEVVKLDQCFVHRYGYSPRAPANKDDVKYWRGKRACGRSTYWYP